MTKPAETAAGLRRMAFDTVLEPVAAARTDGQPRSFGLIHEFRQQWVLVTLAAFDTGDLSLYFSNGGGILGGGQRPTIAEMVRKTVPLIGPLTPQFERSDDIDPPAEGELTFTVLTDVGRFRSRLQGMPVPDMKDANYQLFALAQGLIGELRKVSEAARG